MTRSVLSRYAAAVGMVAIVVILRPTIEGLTGNGTPAILYLPAVTLAAWYGGLGPGLLATLLGGGLWAYLDMTPVGSFRIATPADQFRIVVFVFEGCLLSVLMEMLHGSRRTSDKNAREAEIYRAASVANEARFRAILDNSSTPIWMKDPAGRYLVVNRPFEALAHRRSAEVVGKTDTDLLLPPIMGPLDKHDRSVLEQGQTVETEETVEFEDGPRTFLTVTFPMLDPAGHIYAIGGISTDITALKQAQRRALQAERLAAIGQMITGLAHESRNALQRSQACLEMLAYRLEDRPDTLDLAAGIQDANDDLQRLFEEVRCYASPLIIERRDCRLREVLHEAWSHLEWTLRGRDAGLVESGSDDDHCQADATRMVQVFRNVLDNSLAACHDPVVITVEWSGADLAGQAALRVAIRDNGPGFSAQQRHNLFEPFYTTKTQGTGLGMAIARRIVEVHGGSIAVGAEGGPGAEIVILLPKGHA